MRAVQLLVALISIVGASQTSADSLSSIIKTLKDLVTDNKKTAETQRVTYAKLKCWADKSIENLKANIEENTRVRDETEAAIGGDRAKNAEASQMAYDLERQIADAEAELVDEAQKQQTRNAEFVARKTELDGFIEQLNNAIPKLAAVGADQTSGDAGAENTARMAGFAGVQLKARVQRALAQHESLLQVLGPHTYESKSSQLVGMLKQMKDDFGQEVVDSTEIDQKMTKMHDDFKTDMEGVVAKKKESKAAQEAIIADAIERLGVAFKQNADAKSFLEQDSLSLEDMKLILKDKTKEYNEFVADNARLIEGMNAAIKILNSDEAFKGMSGLKTNKFAGFLQLKDARFSSGLYLQSPRNVLAKKLHLLSLSTNSFAIAKLSVDVRQGKAFDAVCKVITDVIGQIEKDIKTEEKEKETCSQLETDKDAEKGRAESKKSNLETAIEGNNNAITGFNEAIDTLSGEIETLEKEVKETLQKKKEEQEAWDVLDENSVTSLKLLKNAIAVLNDFQERPPVPAATEFEQQSPTASAAVTIDKTKGAKAFEVNDLKNAYAGVISTLQTLRQEVDQEHQKAEVEHVQAVKDFDAALKDKRESIDTKQTSLGNAQKNLANEKAAKEDNEKELEATKENIEAIQDVIANNKPNCDFLKTNFADRKVAKEKEIQGLKDASTSISC